MASAWCTFANGLSIRVTLTWQSDILDTLEKSHTFRHTHAHTDHVQCQLYVWSWRTRHHPSKSLKSILQQRCSKNPTVTQVKHQSYFWYLFGTNMLDSFGYCTHVWPENLKWDLTPTWHHSVAIIYLMQDIVTAGVWYNLNDQVPSFARPQKESGLSPKEDEFVFGLRPPIP